MQRREFPGFPRLAPLLAGPRLMRSYSVPPRMCYSWPANAVSRVSARALQPAGVLGLRVIARQTGSQSEGFAPPAGRDHHDIRAADAVDHAREDAESRSGTPWTRYAWHQHGIHRLLQSRRPTRNPQRKRTDRAEGSADLPAIDIVRFAGRNLRDATAGDAGVLMANTHLGACLYTLARQHK